MVEEEEEEEETKSCSLSLSLITHHNLFWWSHWEVNRSRNVCVPNEKWANSVANFILFLSVDVQFEATKVASMKNLTNHKESREKERERWHFADHKQTSPAKTLAPTTFARLFVRVSYFITICSAVARVSWYNS